MAPRQGDDRVGELRADLRVPELGRPGEQLVDGKDPRPYRRDAELTRRREKPLAREALERARRLPHVHDEPPAVRMRAGQMKQPSRRWTRCNLQRLHQRVVLLLRHRGQVEENAYWPAVPHYANLRGPAVTRKLSSCPRGL